MGPVSNTQMMGSGRVKVAGGVPYYFFIILLTNHCPPRSLNCVLDTGSMATVCQSKYLTNQDYFFNEKAEKRDVQVVGAKTTKQDTYKLLIGVNDSHHSHVLSNCLAGEKIVDPIQKVDLSNVMVAAYHSYVECCKQKKSKPIEFSQWPSGQYGGEISCLIGIGDIKFTFLHFFQGLTFVRHNLKAESPIAYGGSYVASHTDTNTMTVTVDPHTEERQATNCDQTYKTTQPLTGLAPHSTNTSHTQHSNTHLSYAMMTAVKPEKAKMTQDDTKPDFDAVLNDFVTEKHEGVTYADVTSLNCIEIETKELPTKKFFDDLGLIIPKEIEGSCIIRTPGRKGNCLLYSVAKLIYKSPNPQTVDDMRLKLQKYLYNKDIESMYASLIFPTRMYTSEYGNVMIKNFEELRKFIQSKFFISYWLSEFELPSVATLFNVDLTIHYISKGRGDTFGNSVNMYVSKGSTTGRKLAKRDITH